MLDIASDGRPVVNERRIVQLQRRRNHRSSGVLARCNVTGEKSSVGAGASMLSGVEEVSNLATHESWSHPSSGPCLK